MVPRKIFLYDITLFYKILHINIVTRLLSWEELKQKKIKINYLNIIKRDIHIIYLWI